MSLTIDPRWRWHYDPEGSGAPAYRLRTASAGALGTLEIWMPGATAAQFAEMQRRLVARFNPAFEVPATRFVDIDVMGYRAGGHNSGND